MSDAHQGASDSMLEVEPILEFREKLRAATKAHERLGLFAVHIGQPDKWPKKQGGKKPIFDSWLSQCDWRSIIGRQPEVKFEECVWAPQWLSLWRDHHGPQLYEAAFFDVEYPPSPETKLGIEAFNKIAEVGTELFGDLLGLIPSLKVRPPLATTPASRWFELISFASPRSGSAVGPNYGQEVVVLEPFRHSSEVFDRLVARLLEVRRFVDVRALLGVEELRFCFPDLDQFLQSLPRTDWRRPAIDSIEERHRAAKEKWQSSIAPFAAHSIPASEAKRKRGAPQQYPGLSDLLIAKDNDPVFVDEFNRDRTLALNQIRACWRRQNGRLVSKQQLGELEPTNQVIGQRIRDLRKTAELRNL